MIYILNESSKKDVRGTLEFYESLDDLLLDIEAIDVRNNEFFAFTSDGREIALSADGDYALVKGEPESVASQSELVRDLICEHLR